MPKPTSLVPHEFAEILPAMSDSDFDSLRESLKTDGYIGPPIYTFEGKILDGVHRHRLCVELGIKPPFVKYAGADAFRFALNQNLSRRHLNASQRAMVAARMVTTKKHRTVRRPGHDGSIDPSSQPAAAAALKVSVPSVKRAKKLIATKNTDMIAEVDAGELSVSRALALIEGGQTRHAVETGAIEWYTPAVYIDAARDCMGGIDLDPASCEAANAIVQADRFFALEDDGLVQPWVGRVWLNPPYTSKAMAGFVDRFAAHDHGCILVNTVTETAYGQILLQACPVVCFHAGRISFSSPHGQKAGSGTVGQMIGYRGPTPEAFADAFAPFGTILRPW